ncbi:Ca-activated chloride channel family protein [Pontibacter ummariensis]|uniref:Ca-activated chloride channel family protein n=1 Tax=Pontibacter ummariensis TaxID=1610492 RepID=A0A239I9P7_9BACT|nr:VWA domain-containing protein [Pontibacter ummariensis]PRY09992.1 Ca-activated chloride channel family protein [Pontibacter ummariensis]SNS89773.1 Ca-activated chloride channel family protein [Pontibacter ummariensis]
MKKYVYMLLFALLMVGLRAQAQERTITGTVRDAQDGQPIPGVTVHVKGTRLGTTTSQHGKYSLAVPDENVILVFAFIGYKSQEVKVKQQQVVDVQLRQDTQALEEVVVTGYGLQRVRIRGVSALGGKVAGVQAQGAPSLYFDAKPTAHNTENYAYIKENTFQDARKTPLSTFSIDVDNAAYSNVRRFLNNGQRPPKDAVRIEEMINYFSYDYPQPTGEVPFSITTELSGCPWNKESQLLHIGLQGREVPTGNLPASNLVFLIDVSGSMLSEDKLPLVKAGFKLLVDQLRAQDKVALVVYAGSVGLVLPSTAGNQKDKIMQAINNLEAGGSTAGGAGIKLAYQVAQDNFIEGGNNRVILATDGDFNVGVSSDSELQRLIEEKRETGVNLTVLGFGTGNLKDSRMEQLADKGNGNYAYVDNILEAKKVFVNEFGGTLFTIAKDVKLQLEFNPGKVKAYRLIGYENRILEDKDFNDDKKDAGDLGSGHTVTALYEIIPANERTAKSYTGKVDDLKYQQTIISSAASSSDEILTLKLRYKDPNGNKSRLLENVVTAKAVPTDETSDDFRFSAAVAACGMLLRDSEHKGTATYPTVLELAEGARGQDKEGYRIEFINLVKSMNLLSDGR